MIQQSISPILSRPWAETVQGAMLGELSATMHVHLFTAAPGTITPGTVPGDFTPAAFAGYSAQSFLSADLNGPALSANENAVLLFGVVSFLAGAVVFPGETVLGYYITDSTDAILYQSEYFPEPWIVTLPGQLLSLEILLPTMMVGSLS